MFAASANAAFNSDCNWLCCNVSNCDVFGFCLTTANICCAKFKVSCTIATERVTSSGSCSLLESCAARNSAELSNSVVKTFGGGAEADMVLHRVSLSVTCVS